MLGSRARRGGAWSWILQPRFQGDSKSRQQSFAAEEGGAAWKTWWRQSGSICRPGARTRGARGCGRTRAAGASFLQRGSGRVPALEVQRVGYLPGALARHPTDRPGARTGPRPGAWRRSPRASFYSGVWAFYPVRKARRLCPGMAGDAGGGGRGFRQTLAWGKDWDGQAPVGAPWGFRGTAPSRAPETGARASEGRRVPRGWAPRRGQPWGRRPVLCALTYTSARTRHKNPGFH